MMMVHVIDAVIDALHNKEIKSISVAVMPYVVKHIIELLETFQIPYHINPAFVYYDPVTGNNFVVHPETHERLWIADKLALQFQGFARLTKEVPQIEPATVAEASPYED